jgi:hypothetical protein
MGIGPGDGVRRATGEVTGEPKPVSTAQNGSKYEYEYAYMEMELDIEVEGIPQAAAYISPFIPQTDYSWRINQLRGYSLVGNFAKVRHVDVD